MLSLMSSSTARLTGTRAVANWVTGCLTPSSRISNSSLVRSVTTRPPASVTVAVTVTTSTLDSNFFWELGEDCAASRPAGASMPARLAKSR